MASAPGRPGALIITASLENGKLEADPPFPDNVANRIVGGNEIALAASASEAGRRGYQILSLGSENSGEANDEGRALAERCRRLARLMTFNNAVITSHQAYLTHEALANIADTTLGNIDEFAQGKRGADLTNAVQDQ